MPTSTCLSVYLAAFEVVVIHHDDAVDGVDMVQVVDEVSLPEVNRDFSCNPHKAHETSISIGWPTSQALAC